MNNNVSMVDGHVDMFSTQKSGTSDLISRSALIEKCNETIEWLTGIIHRMNDAEGQMLATREKGAFMEILRELEKAPSVDAVPVVRCKDCVHWAEAPREWYGKDCGLCTNCIMDTNKEFYCSYGERKGEA